MGVEITHPAAVMVFMLIGFGLGMAAGYATCYVNKSDEDLMKHLERYANLWVLTAVAVITAFIKVHMDYEGFLPVAGPVIQKYQLLFALGAIGLSIIICFFQMRGVRKQ
jgi:amino acid transporter